MKKTFLPVLMGAVLLGMTSGSAHAEMKDDMRYLGYSEEISRLANENIHTTHQKYPTLPKKGEPTPEQKILDEADAVKEQLAELGKTRAMTPDMPAKAGETKDKLETYWKTMQPRDLVGKEALTPEFKEELKQKLANAIQGAGYEIRQLDLIDVPTTAQVRAVIRVVRPLKSKNSYQELQRNLAEMKDLCLANGTIDGTQYLSELTTFLAENPTNKYFYEKTVLTP